MGPGEQPRIAPIWVSPDDWTRQQGELQALRGFKAEQERLSELKEAERIRLMAEKGQIQEAFELQKASYQKKLDDFASGAKQIETEWLNERKAAIVSAALTGRNFNGEDPSKTAELLRTILEGEIEAVRDTDGKPVIRDKKTMRPATDYLKERLDSKEFGMFFVAQHRGGSGADGARPAATMANSESDPNTAFAKAFLAAKSDAKNARF